MVVLNTLGLGLALGTDWYLVGFILCFSGSGIVVAHLLIPHWQGVCEVIHRFDARGKSVWLTIDDGPDPEDTPRVLALLERYQAKATFFMIGARAEKYPELVCRVIAAGHTIGTHTHSHPMATYWCAGPQRVADELDRSLAALAVSQTPIALYRSPVGIKNLFLQRALRERGLRCVAWTIRSGDGLGRNPQKIINRVRHQLRPGAIILMHEGPRVASTVRITALEGVLEAIKTQGYRCVIPELAKACAR